MKIKPGFQLRDVCGEKVVIAQGIDHLDFTHLITLNESAAYIFSALGTDDFDADTVTRLLTAEYDIDEATAHADAENLINSWLSQGLIH